MRRSRLFAFPTCRWAMRRGPRIVATQQGIVITAIGGAQGKGKDGDVLAYRSTDKGRTWNGPVKVNDAEAIGARRLACDDMLR